VELNQLDTFRFCSPSEIRTEFLLAQNVTVQGIQNSTHVVLSVFARRQKFKLSSYWLRMLHYVEYRTTHTDINPGFCHAENLVTVPSHQTHLYYETLTPRPNNRSVSAPCDSRGRSDACRRAAWPSTTSMPSLLLLLLQTHAVHTEFSLSTLHPCLTCNEHRAARTRHIREVVWHAPLPSSPQLCARSHPGASLCSRSSIQT
jgi:hypothetical protein